MINSLFLFRFCFYPCTAIYFVCISFHIFFHLFDDIRFDLIILQFSLFGCFELCICWHWSEFKIRYTSVTKFRISKPNHHLLRYKWKMKYQFNGKFSHSTCVIFVCVSVVCVTYYISLSLSRSLLSLKVYSCPMCRIHSGAQVMWNVLMTVQTYPLSINYP